MLSNNARILVVLSLILIAIFSAYLRVFEISIFCIFLVGLTIYGYFKEGTVILAAKQFHHKNYEAAKNLLLSIPHPTYLHKKRISYYHYLLGSIAIQQLDYEQAEAELSKAAVLGLKAQDLIKALMQLANLSLRNKNKQKGLFWIAEAEKHKTNLKNETILNNIKTELNKING